MENHKEILVVVSNYPYGYGEPFFENELIELEKKFHKVTLIITTEIKHNKQLFHIGSNTELTFLTEFKSPEKIKTSMYLNILRELFFVLFFFKRFPTLSIVSDAHYYEKNKMIYLKKIRNLIFTKKNQGQIVFYTYWMDQFTYIASEIKKNFPELKVYSRVHGWDLYFERHKSNYLPFRKKIIENITKTFTISEQGKIYLINKFKLISANIEVSYLGTTKRVFNNHIYDNQTLHIVSISFLSPVKNVELIINLLSKNENSIKWTHIGNGDLFYFKKIKEYANTKLGNHPNIEFEFKGMLNKVEIENFLQSSPIDLFLNTSHSEGLPVSIMEVFSCGIPAIAPNIGGVSEIVKDEVNGFLLSKNPNTQEINTCLDKYMKKRKDEIRAMKQSALNTWERKFNADTNFSSFVNSLNSF